MSQEHVGDLGRHQGSAQLSECSTATSATASEAAHDPQAALQREVGHLRKLIDVQRSSVDEMERLRKQVRRGTGAVIGRTWLDQRL